MEVEAMAGAQGTNIHVDHEDLRRILKEITTYVVDSQDIDTGGWSADPDARGSRSVDVWTTSQVVLWMAQVNFELYRERIENAVMFLLQEQEHGSQDDDEDEDPVNVDGGRGWGWQRNRPRDTTATSLAVRALLRYHSHIAVPDPRINESIIAGRDWLINNRHHEGGFALFQTDPHPLSFNTCWCSIALQECANTPGFQWPAIAGAIDSAVELVLRARRMRGWGREVTSRANPLGVAYCTYLLLRRGYTNQAALGIDWLRTHQNDDGYWLAGVDNILEPTAWALITLLTNKERPDGFRIQSAVTYLQQLYVQGRGWPRKPNDSPTVWTSYYAFLALTAYLDAAR